MKSGNMKDIKQVICANDQETNLQQLLHAHFFLSIMKCISHIPYFAVYNAHPCFWPKLSRKKPYFNFLTQFIYLFIFRNKTDYCIPGYYFAYELCF